MGNSTFEIEKKFLINLPNMEILERQEKYEKTHIIQTYLISDEENAGLRIRKRGHGENYVYTKTYKMDITALRRIEIENEITKEEYEQLLKKADPSLNSIDKHRHTFIYKGKLLELDIYKFWNDKATLEIELESEDEPFYIPDFIKIIKDVTTDRRYRNRNLANNVLIENF